MSFIIEKDKSLRQYNDEFEEFVVETIKQKLLSVFNGVDLRWFENDIWIHRFLALVLKISFSNLRKINEINFVQFRKSVETEGEDVEGEIWILDFQAGSKMVHFVTQKSYRTRIST